jgi:3-hydroxyisobutyrate dehydrogenase-like beta-hydroxyacid dehydrogenase/alkylhydroperoxidase/carboxymuconolactone decarboxylase family protein YurZ
VLVAVVDAQEVRTVLTGDDGLLAGSHPGLVVVILSTIAISEIQELAATCDQHNVALLDCGVTPGDKAPDNGMVAMLGGPPDVVARAMPVLNDFAKRVVYCGELGAGMITKIARNVVTYGGWRAVDEAACLLEAADIEPSKLITVIEDADPEGATLLKLLRLRLSNPHEGRISAGGAEIIDKDLAAAQMLAQQLGVQVPLIDVTRSTLAHSDEDVEAASSSNGTDSHDEFARGISALDAVYGPGFSSTVPGDADDDPTLSDTIRHLFGEVWMRPYLSIRDRRLLVMGATAMLGRADLIRRQAEGALHNRELTSEQLREAVLQLHYYVGWGNGRSVRQGVEQALAAHAERKPSPSKQDPDPDAD